jgi:hypothetical protein
VKSGTGAQRQEKVLPNFVRPNEEDEKSYDLPILKKIYLGVRTYFAHDNKQREERVINITIHTNLKA